MKVVCEHCKESFELTQDDLKEKYLGAMISEVYFICPHCNKKFIVCLKNPKTREFQRKIDELKKIIAEKQRLKYKWIPESLEIEKVVNELKQEMNRLNGKA